MCDPIRFNLRKAGKDSERKGVPSATSAAVPDASVSPEEVLEGAVHAVLLTDQSGHIRAASAAAARMLGCGRDDLVGRNLADVVARMDDVLIGVALKAHEAGRRVEFDVVCCRRDGGMFPADCQLYLVSKLKTGEKQLYFLLNRAGGEGKADAGDVMAARLIRAERLEMAGTLAGQIAHDFNNLLTPLLAYPELIRKELPSEMSVMEYIDIMEKTAGDMSRLTQQLLSLARRGQVGNEEVNVNAVVEEVIKLIQTTVAGGISIEFDLADNVLPVKGSKDQLRRVVENLCQNALDAMEDKGCLRLRAENIYLDAPVGHYENVNLGEYVKISVSDTGLGIAPEIQEKIFDPFFTTKRGGKNRGTGLGLSIVHGIVLDHKGYIDLVTEPGRGSTFFVYIPVYRHAVPKLDGMSLPRGNEAILVVDDDELQVNIMVSLLQALGYRVMGVGSGEECVRMMRDEGFRFDLIVLDMVLDGGMGGLETFEAVHQLNPGQKVVLVSGFSKTARDVVKAQELGAGVYLRKPLTVERVARSVREALDAAPAPGARRGGGGRSKRILVVDDEQMIRKLFGMIILTEMPDAVIDQAANGKEALKAYEEGHHDLVIMDLQMPVQDGREAFAAIGRLCARKQWPLPPVIFCTGFSPPASLNAIIGDGSMHCLLRKPVKADALLTAVRQRLRD